MAARKKSRAPKTRTLTSELEAVMETLDLGSPYLEDSVNDQAWQDKEHFMKEWLEEQDEDTPLSVSQIEAADEAVWQAIEQDYSDSITYKRGEALVQAAQDLSDASGIESQWSFNRDNGIVSVTLDQSFVKAWREATTGHGMFPWDPSLGLSDVKNVSSVINILNQRAEVYGMPRFARAYENEWDRWEPGGTQNYRTLSALANEAAGL